MKEQEGERKEHMEGDERKKSGSEAKERERRVLKRELRDRR